ncbi:cytochrome c1 [Sphingomonas sanxanigenens]|uniref:Cytochrome c1 n=1 Tax=Sphingomonas sanxanigenens DSM 19645 = NX02 TaxID=1123269 RepID=W0A488_9SPHN|nr:cytochrome c1 [Sphingomonas sanxanigenens]AHE51851.1 cytochrome C [Sphingomonas sanxanigenens DSM 19645 = NX02]
MVRLIGFLVGLGFVGVVLWSFLWGVVSYIEEPPVPTVEHEFHLSPKQVSWSFDGPLGKFDRAQLQRGFQVYKEVCSACHSLRLVSFRDLADLGYSEPEIKAIAEQWVVEQPSINPETGEPATRKSIASDRFPSPFANEVAARAANAGALPPDLSLITKARHDGSNYVHSLITGYRPQPAELLKEFPDAKTPDGLHFNPYFANLNLAMAPPLTGDGQVTYADGTKSTTDQMARDIAAFLTWTAEPKLENRKRTGVAVVGFLIILTVLAFLSYKNIWAGKKH